MKKLLFVIILLMLSVSVYGQSQSRIAAYNHRHNPVAIVKGDIGDKTAVFLLGHNNSVAATDELVSAQSAAYVYLPKGEKLTVGATSANDDTSGTGARTVKLWGVDSSFAYQTETLTIAGAETVSTSNKFARCWKAEVLTAGSGGVNAGEIQIMNDASDTTLQIIPAGWNGSRAAMITVPAGSTLYVIGWSASEDQAKATEVSIWECPDDLAWIQRDAMVIKQQSAQYLFPVPLEFAAQSDVEFRAKSTGASGNVIVTFYGWYE